MYVLANDCLRAGHIACELPIRALIEDPRSDGIALRGGQLGDQSVEAPRVPERREFLHPLEVAVFEDNRLVTQPRARRWLSSSLCSAISNSQPAAEPRSESNRWRLDTTAANVSAVERELT